MKLRLLLFLPHGIREAVRDEHDDSCHHTHQHSQEPIGRGNPSPTAPVIQTAAAASVGAAPARNVLGANERVRVGLIGCGTRGLAVARLMGEVPNVAFVAVCAIILSMYGGGFATVPAYLKDLFGSMQVGAIHGRLLTAWSVAGVLGPVIVNAIADAQATPTFVSGHIWGPTSESNNSNAPTLTVSPTGGTNHLLVCMGRDGDKVTTGITFSDTTSNVWQTMNAAQENIGANTSAGTAYVVNPAGGTYTVTATFTQSDSSTAQKSGIICAEYSGVAASSPLDATASGQTLINATSDTTGPFSTSKAGLVVVFATLDHDASFTAGSIGGNTATLRTTGSSFASALEDTTFASAQSLITASMSDGNNHWIIMAGACKTGP